MKRFVMAFLACIVCIGCLSACDPGNAKVADTGSEGGVEEIALNNPENTSEPVQTEAPSIEPSPRATEQAPEKKGYDKIISNKKVEEFGGTVKVGNTAYELYNYTDSAATNYANIVNEVASKLKGRADVYDMIAPTSMGITFPDNKVDKVNSTNQKRSIKSIYKKLDKSVKKISLYHALMSHRKEYIYFRTDHHWTDKGAYYAYQKFCQKKKITPHELSEYKRDNFGDYLGSFYVDTKESKSLKTDQVKIFYPVSDKKIQLTYQDDKGGEYTANAISDGTNFGISLKYVCFLSGDNPFSIVKNKKIKDGSSCLVVKESYGNPFVPFLADHYQTIYVVDYRYWTGSISSLALEKKVDEVIFLNNISMTRNAYLIGKLAQVK